MIFASTLRVPTLKRLVSEHEVLALEEKRERVVREYRPKEGWLVEQGVPAADRENDSHD